MKFSPTRIINMIVIIIAVFLNYSCSKDSDLLADYVVNENAGNPGNLTDLQDGTIITYEDKMVAINILRDIQSSAARKGTILKKVTPPKNGKTEIKTDSTIVYTPNKDFTGKDDVVYVVEETAPDNTTVEKENTIVVAVNPVLEIKDDKVQTSANKNVIIPVLKNDTYSDKNTATVTQTTTPAKGTVIINNDNTLTYTPNADASGSDTFTYTAQVENAEKTASTINKGTVTVDFEKTVGLPEDDNGELKAFPSAHGFGRYASGGRGGSVIQVTNLNDSGPGSLRAALTASGKRTIIFRVGGTINLSSYITVTNPDFTIAGETAPGQGIQIDGSGGLQIQASNFIIRHMRFRGSSVISNLRIITSSGPIENGIIDHCSFSWPDPAEMNISIEATSSNGNQQAKDISIQNCIIGEATRGILLYKGHYQISIYKTLFANVQQRCINANRPTWMPPNKLSFEEINCIAHNTQIEMIQAGYGTRYSAIGCERSNAPGSYTSSAPTLADFYSYTDQNGPADGPKENSWLYEKDNKNSVGPIYDSETAPYVKATPYASSDITGDLILKVDNISSMLPTLGAFYWNRDAVDTRYINDYLNNTGSVGTYTGTPPALDKGTPYTDTDGDGMSDAWEAARGLNPNVADHNGDDDGDGYTNLEEFLHYRALGN